MSMQRLSISMSDELVYKIDLYSDFMGISRTGAINVLVTTQLQTLGIIKPVNDDYEDDDK